MPANNPQIPYCDICGFGLAHHHDGDLAICNRHTPAALQRWKNDGAITYAQREQLCNDAASTLLIPLSEEDQRRCETAHKETNLDCPECPFKKGWMY